MPRKIVSPKRTNARQLAGRRFGRLKVIEETENRSINGQIVWRCRCDCGGEALAMTSNLTSGNTASCGCWQREVSRRPGRRHQ